VPLEKQVRDGGRHLACDVAADADTARTHTTKSDNPQNGIVTSPTARPARTPKALNTLTITPQIRLTPRPSTL
jgi:hypothetical protein